MPDLITEMVGRSDQAKGFVVLPRRWIVERTHRLAGYAVSRLAEDWENLNHNALAFHPPRIDTPDAQKALYSLMKSPDGLSGSDELAAKPAVATRNTLTDLAHRHPRTSPRTTGPGVDAEREG